MFDEIMTIISTSTFMSVVSAVVIFLAVIYFLYRLFRRGIGLLLKGIDFAIPPLALLVAFALAATIFSSGAADLWSVVYGLVQLLFIQFPRALVQIFFTTNVCNPADCFLRVAGTIANSVQNLFSISVSYLRNVISVVQLFALWAVLAWGLGDLLNPAAAPGSSKGLRRLIADMSPIARLRVSLGSIIVLGAYFCFCAIVAVSLFKPPEKAQVLDEKQLEDTLNKIKLGTSGDDSAFAQRFPEDLEGLPKLPDKPTPEAGPAGAPPSPPNSSKPLGELPNLWKQLRAQMAAEQDRLLQRAIASYKIENLNRVGTREQANHYLALNKWFQSAEERLFSHLDTCRAAISNAAFFANEGAKATISPSVNPSPVGRPDFQMARPGSSGDPLAPGPGIAVPFQIPTYTDRDTVTAQARSACQVRSLNIEDPPDRSDFGYQFGIVGDVAVWLLRTESMPLALITGLIGFGLFGALVSAFVRTPPGQQLQLDIFSVVCRGVSAAIVVFLAAYGGIAIVSQTSSDPNPYLVFVTCLVGAVFGDDVWLWARKKFVPREETAEGASKTNTVA
jgi:hypothetical protein